jgi:hypothetical protein
MDTFAMPRNHSERPRPDNVTLVRLLSWLMTDGLEDEVMRLPADERDGVIDAMITYLDRLRAVQCRGAILTAEGREVLNAGRSRRPRRRS